MQDRYVGDIGDYVKFAILRALATDRKLGVAWWRHPDETHNKDGRHIKYLEEDNRWRALDADLYDTLQKIVNRGLRQLSVLEDVWLLPNVVYHNTLLPTSGVDARKEWLDEAISWFHNRDIIFVDPDNGFEPASFGYGKSKKDRKSVSISELKRLSEGGRPLIVYHHQTRKAGGHIAELKYWGNQLAESGFITVDAIRSKPYSPRAFFLLNAPEDIRMKAEGLTRKWDGMLSWHHNLHLT